MISWRNWTASRPRAAPTLPSGETSQRSESGWPLRLSLLLWVTIALVPIALVSILQGVERARVDVGEVHDRLIRSAEAAAADQENLLLSAEQVARALSNMRDVRDATRHCDEILSDALIGVRYFANIARIDRGWTVACSALPSARGLKGDAKLLPMARSARRFFVSGQIASPLLRRPIIAGMLPVRDARGAFDGVISITLELRWLDLMVRAQDLPKGAVVFVYDDAGHVLASNNLAVAATLMHAKSTVGDNRALRAGTDASGRDWTIAASNLRGSEIHVAYAMPETRLFLSTYLHVGVDFLLPILMIGLAWAGIWFTTERQVTQWIAYLRRISAAYRSGHYTIRPQLEDAPSEFRALGDGMSEMAESIQDRDRKLREALAQKTLLIREIHHRVKNNLQIVMSLLSLQAGQLKDPAAREALMQAQVRINALALVHRILHEIEDQTTIDLKRLLHELTTQITEGMRGEMKLTVEEHLVDAEVSGDVAVPVALFAVEALTNIFKYAFPPGYQGVVKIDLVRNGDNRLKLTIADNGIGFDEKQARGGIGTRLIRTFGQQIGGKSMLHSVPGKGTSIEVDFKDSLAEAA
ncbi:MAG: sensor histidine kinase [Alphaproteobacteria bacterium]|nr:sensor histidine kinase [Alphaproteobacteria bacterium]